MPELCLIVFILHTYDFVVKKKDGQEAYGISQISVKKSLLTIGIYYVINISTRCITTLGNLLAL